MRAGGGSSKAVWREAGGSGFSQARQDVYLCLLFKHSTMSQAVEAPHAAANVPIKTQLPLRLNASNVASDETPCR